MSRAVITGRGTYTATMFAKYMERARVLVEIVPDPFEAASRLDGDVVRAYIFPAPPVPALFPPNGKVFGDEIAGLVRFVNACAQERVPVVYTSSMTVTKSKPTTWRDMMLMQVEHMMETTSELRNLKAVCLKLAEVYGPGENIDKDGASEISHIMWAIREYQRPRILGDPDVSGDFLHINDLCELIWKTSRWMNSGAGHMVFEVGSGVRTRLGSITRMINECYGFALIPEYEGGREIYKTPKIKKLKDEMDWEPMVEISRGVHALCRTTRVSGLTIHGNQ